MLNRATLLFATLALIAAPALDAHAQPSAGAPAIRPTPRQRPAPGHPGMRVPDGTGDGTGGGVGRPPPTPVPAPIDPPVPAPELVAAGKAMKGTWRCRGFLSNPDGSSTPTTGTMKIALDLDGFWLISDYVEARSKAPMMPHPTHLRMARTFDARTRTWTALSLANNGTGQTLTSTDTASPMTWTGALVMGGTKVATRDHEELDAKTHEDHLWGEFSADGTSYLKTYDLRCKK
jgi:hypothetical protein